MSPLARSLLALAAAALLHGACAAQIKLSDAQCTTVMHGNTTNDEHDFKPVPIDAGIQAASVTIPNPCSYDSEVAGELVMACDDVPPTVYVPPLPQYSPAVVSRNGDFNHNVATVTVIIWCRKKKFES